MQDLDAGTADEISRLTTAKRELEASSRAIHKAWRVAQHRGLAPRKLERLTVLKDAVYQEISDVDLLLRLLTPEE